MKPTRRLVTVILALLLLAAVGWLDYRSGYEVSLTAFYAVPIAWVTWVSGIGAGLLFSLLSGLIWLWADLASGEHYQHPWHAWERMGMNLVSMAFVCATFRLFRRKLEEERRKVRQLQGVLPVCSSCRNVADENGYWTTIDRYLLEHTDARVQAKLCPECARARYLGERQS